MCTLDQEMWKMILKSQTTQDNKLRCFQTTANSPSAAVSKHCGIRNLLTPSSLLRMDVAKDFFVLSHHIWDIKKKLIQTR